MHNCVNGVAAREAHARIGSLLKRSNLLVYEVDGKGLTRYMSPNCTTLIGTGRLRVCASLCACVQAGLLWLYRACLVGRGRGSSRCA